MKATRSWLLAVLVFISYSASASNAEEQPWGQTEKNGNQAQDAFRHCIRFLNGWLAHRDPQSGLIPRNLTESFFWNAADSAADNYPFMVLTAAMLDPERLNTTMLKMLETERRLTDRLDHLPDHFDFATQKFLYTDIDLYRLIFGASEYAKDGLMPITEWMGKSPWSDRMIEIIESVWKHAPVDTPYGKIPAADHEVNGDNLQVLCRLYWMTKDEKYREWAFRIADYLLLDHLLTESDRLQLDDHGCESVEGLAGAYFMASHIDPERKRKYHDPIHRMMDRILEVGVNADGLVYELINPKTGEILRSELSDNWGYNYNGILNVAQLDQDQRYYDATRKLLENIYKYKDYKWENGGSDGYADAVEGGINLLNRIPVESAWEWVEYSINIMLNKQREDGIIEGWHGDGNYARTALMYALWKTQGTTLQPWRADISFGALQQKDTLFLTMKSDWIWSGRIVFDLPRHQEYLHLPADYPRINQFPEWFTVKPGKEYAVKIHDQKPIQVSGSKLHEGLHVKTEAGKSLCIEVSQIQ